MAIMKKHKQDKIVRKVEKARKQGKSVRIETLSGDDASLSNEEETALFEKIKGDLRAKKRQDTKARKAYFKAQGVTNKRKSSSKPSSPRRKVKAKTSGRKNAMLKKAAAARKSTAVTERRQRRVPGRPT